MTRLEYLRRVRGLSQEQLGRALIYSRSVVSRLEKERPSPQSLHPRLRHALEQWSGEDVAICFRKSFCRNNRQTE